MGCLVSFKRYVEVLIPGTCERDRSYLEIGSLQMNEVERKSY